MQRIPMLKLQQTISKTLPVFGFRKNSPPAVAKPVGRKFLCKAIQRGQVLGETKDGKTIYLIDHKKRCAVIREIGRLREISFRAVGEGSMKRRDLDMYDRYYRHIVLWDAAESEIIGAYRIGEAKNILSKLGKSGLYTNTLFNLHNDFIPVLEQSIELGRSFIQPKYWGKRSLDYLWQGIGAYLRINPEIRYLFGPVSISNDYSHFAKQLLVRFYSAHFPGNNKYATPLNPVSFSENQHQQLAAIFPGIDYDRELSILKEQLSQRSHCIPVLYKRYTELCKKQGIQFLGFNIDHNFSDCIDGLILLDLKNLKNKKRKRYIG